MTIDRWVWTIPDTKLVERVAARQLRSHLETAGLYIPVKSANRKILNDSLLVADRGDAALLALLDQSAAFVTIDRRILLQRIRLRFGMDGTALAWLRSYSSNRVQAVSVAGMISSPCLLHWGVPQGSFL